MKKCCVRICLSVLVVGLLSSAASAHPQFMKALKDKYEFKLVSCFACHMKGKDPATDKPYGKDVRNEFGELFLPYFEGKDVNGRVEKSAEAKRNDNGDEAEKIDAGLTADFLEALEKVEALTNGVGKSYADLLKAGEIDGTRLAD